MDDRSQKDDMRAALRADRERALERWRDEGREPVFVAPEAAAGEQPESTLAGEPPAPEPAPTPSATPARRGWLRRLLGRG